jgi:hypothetical protein
VHSDRSANRLSFDQDHGEVEGVPSCVLLDKHQQAGNWCYVSKVEYFTLDSPSCGRYFSNIPSSMDLQWGATPEVLEAAPSQPGFEIVGLEFLDGPLLEGIAARFGSFRREAAPR